MSNYVVCNSEGMPISWHATGNDAIAARDQFDTANGNARFTSLVLTGGQYANLRRQFVVRTRTTERNGGARVIVWVGGLRYIDAYDHSASDPHAAAIARHFPGHTVIRSATDGRTVNGKAERLYVVAPSDAL